VSGAAVGCATRWWVGAVASVVAVLRPVLMAAVLRLRNKHHAHGCTECSLRYTDACDTPEENWRCLMCRSGQERALWDQNSDPDECCRTLSRQVSDAETVMRYKLGGPGPWFRCDKCSRTHSFNPRSANV
jgi:hypothetical protein